jgi:Protein of unknown function (DUF4058)
MPGPFPGMDPFLEHPALWPGVHQRFITYVGDALNAVLPARYVADIGERLYIVQPERGIYPDVVVLEHPSAQPPKEQGGAATAAVVSDPPWVVTYHQVEMREVFIEILPVADESRVITVIEVLSPSNKAAGSAGRQLYLTKQQELFESQTHVIEIDLLRRGEHTVVVPRERLQGRGHWDYLVCLHRGGQGNRCEVWPVTLRQPLPRIRVPLADGDPDVVLDLQAVFNRCYDEGAYTRRLDYRREPTPPLQREEAIWADQVLRDRGLRS